ncbi:hypothetical protein KFK09_004842 [Dendrobium nobile]|uniref:Endonuclease/exonuclease/phosphatase domain-containing protein n=1 Tax=Dendrobium nobile TaxID=94219 RepID=A0A8T3BYY0_DENNO|nr:hypothetical protein KFK09_004842 [Dendrobium nobile]
MAPKAPGPIVNSFGILSELDDGMLEDLAAGKEGIDIEDGEICEPDRIKIVPEMQIVATSLCLPDSRAVKEIDSASVSAQVVTRNLEVFNRNDWLISTVFGSRNSVYRKPLWEKLEKSNDVNKPAIIGGDFNCILSQEGKRGGKKFVFSQGARDMKMFMSNNDFHEVGFMGPKFTWCNNKSGGGCILERLDRCFMNSYAMNSIQLALVKHLEAFKPINANHKDIHFEDVWASYHGATAIVEKSWKKVGGGDPTTSLDLKFKRTLKALFHWSKAKFKSLNSLRDSLKEYIFNLQLEEAEGLLDDTKLLILRSKISELSTLAKLNVWWRQRAKEKWMEEGDANSAFFHSFANARRCSNWIKFITKADGAVTEQPEEIESVFTDFFNQKWKHRNCMLKGWSRPFAILDTVDHKKLDSEFTKEELQHVVDSLHSNVSLGIDGITFSFVKFYWKIIHQDHGVASFEASPYPLSFPLLFFNDDLIRIIEEVPIFPDQGADQLEIKWKHTGKSIAALAQDSKHRKISLVTGCPRGCIAEENDDHTAAGCIKLKNAISWLIKWGYQVPQFDNFEECFNALHILREETDFHIAANSLSLAITVPSIRKVGKSTSESYFSGILLLPDVLKSVLMRPCAVITWLGGAGAWEPSIQWWRSTGVKVYLTEQPIYGAHDQNITAEKASTDELLYQEDLGDEGEHISFRCLDWRMDGGMTSSAMPKAFTGVHSNGLMECPATSHELGRLGLIRLGLRWEPGGKGHHPKGLVSLKPASPSLWKALGQDRMGRPPELVLHWFQPPLARFLVGLTLKER